MQNRKNRRTEHRFFFFRRQGALLLALSVFLALTGGFSGCSSKQPEQGNGSEPFVSSAGTNNTYGASSVPEGGETADSSGAAQASATAASATTPGTGGWPAGPAGTTAAGGSGTQTAGTGTGGGSSPGSKTTTVTASATTRATTAPTVAPPFSDEVRRVCGSFIQPWLVASWSQDRWEQECAAMAEAGMRYVIVQSVVDFTYNTDANYGQDYTRYTLKNGKAFSLYPSSLSELSGANNGTDSLKNCLAACKKYGMQAILGPVSDNRWWLYGWGIPARPSGVTDTAKDSYMARWVRGNADISNRIADEIMARYGGQYGGQIYAWYYNNEIWNISAACRGTDGGVYAKILADSLNLSLRHYSKITPGKPLMLSPFCNPSLSSAAQCGSMWKSVFALTEFRKGDIFAPQDSFGNNTDMDLDGWSRAYKDAADTKAGLRFWSNNENFRKDYAVARVDEFVNQIRITSRYAEANICFSWNHYYSPKERNPGYNAAYLDYIRNGKLDLQAPGKPAAVVTGTKVVLESKDNIGIWAVRIYRKGQSAPVQERLCRDDGNERILMTFWLNSGSYEVETVDFCGNASPRTVVTIA